MAGNMGFGYLPRLRSFVQRRAGMAADNVKKVVDGVTSGSPGQTAKDLSPLGEGGRQRQALRQELRPLSPGGGY